MNKIQPTAAQRDALDVVLHEFAQNQDLHGDTFYFPITSQPERLHYSAPPCIKVELHLYHIKRNQNSPIEPIKIWKISGPGFDAFTYLPATREFFTE